MRRWGGINRGSFTSAANGNRDIAFAYQLFAVQFTRLYWREKGKGPKGTRRVKRGNARPRPAMHPLQINPPPPVGGETTSLLRTFATSCYQALHPNSPTPSLRSSWFYPRFLLASTCPNPNISASPYFKDERVDLWLGRSRALPTAADTNCSVFRWFFQFRENRVARYSFLEEQTNIVTA